MLGFEWDAQKASRNREKHGITFIEAVSVFADEGALLIDDPDHSAEEDRYILLGLSSALRILVVIHSYREKEDIRIISARRANVHERSRYQRGWKP